MIDAVFSSPPRPTWLDAIGAPPGRRPRIGIIAPGVWRKRAAVGALIGGNPRFVFLPGGLDRLAPVDALLDWGLKRDGRARAEARGLPFVAVEDALLAKPPAALDDGRPLGLAVDPVGIYYDASRPSQLETLIADAAAQGRAHARAGALMALMRAARLGKYNGAPDLQPDSPLGRDRALVVVVDQIAGDLSIAGGGCDAGTFERMVEAAQAENPDAEIVLRLHPYDGVEGRRGHLRPIAEARGLKTVTQDLSWMSLAFRARRVYAATSNAGLEALIAGADVACFGAGFYAGWGLTDDRFAPLARRAARPSLEALVDAVYFRYGRYRRPDRSEACDALAFAEWLAEARRASGLTRAPSAG